MHFHAIECYNEETGEIAIFYTQTYRVLRSVKDVYTNAVPDTIRLQILERDLTPQYVRPLGPLKYLLFKIVLKLFPGHYEGVFTM
jgi:hypothetical protein